MGGKTGNMRYMCAEKELVSLCKPSLAFYTLAHLIIQFLQNPPMEFQNLQMTILPGEGWEIGAILLELGQVRPTRVRG